MFLIVFVTLILSIMGLFIQVASLQTAKLYRAQNGLAQTMLTWHSAATSLALANSAAWTSASAWTTSGCSISPSTNLTVPPTGMPLASGVPLTCPTTLSTANYLVGGYTTTNYSFYSIAYQTPAPATNYVVTFVLCPTASSSNVVLPDSGGAASGFTCRDLNAQLSRLATTTNGVIFGTVSASGVLTISSIAQNGGTTYTIPAWIPTGAIAIISLGS